MFKKIQDHFKKPTGLIGKLVGKMMAVENKTLNKWTVQQLKIRPGKNILEVGYGPGYAIDIIMNRYKNVYLDGIDISKAMKEEASHRLHSEIDDGSVQLLVGDISQYVLQVNHYDVVFTVNNYMLWENKHEGLRNIYKSMKPNGNIAITMQPRQEDANANQASVFARVIQDGLKATGFRRIKVRYKRITPETAVCVTAFKPV